MYELVIEKILLSDKITNRSFLGAFSRDELPKINRYPASFVLNNEKRKERGAHWIAFYFDANKHCDFFDSFANPPSFYKLESYIKQNSSSYSHNTKMLQGSLDLCGSYVVMFIFYASRDFLKKFYSQFSDNLEKNDELVSKI